MSAPDFAVITGNRQNVTLANLNNKTIQFCPSPSGNVTKFAARIIRVMEKLPKSAISEQVFETLQTIL